MKKRFIYCITIVLLITNNIYAINNNASLKYYNDYTYSFEKIMNSSPYNNFEIYDTYNKILDQYETFNFDDDIKNVLDLIVDDCDSNVIFKERNNIFENFLDNSEANILAEINESISDSIANPNIISTATCKQLIDFISSANSSYSTYLKISQILRDSTSVDFFKFLIPDSNEKIPEEWEFLDSDIILYNEYNIDLMVAKEKFILVNNIDKENNISRNLVDNLIGIQNLKDNDEKIKLLKSQENQYKNFSLYWLELIKTYYDSKKYQQVIDTVSYYDSNFQSLNKYNSDYYQILCEEIYSLLYINNDCSISNYKNEILDKLDFIYENSSKKNWLQNYYCSFIYLSFSKNINDESFIKAYDLIRNNCVNLGTKLDNTLHIYNNALVEPNYKIFSKNTVSRLKSFYEKLETTREVELPPDYNAYIFNLRALILLANYSNQIIDVVPLTNRILNPIVKYELINSVSVENNFSNELYLSYLDVDKKKYIPIIGSPTIEINIPANYLNNNSKIEVRFSGDNVYHEVPIKIKKVERFVENDNGAYIATIEFEYKKDWLFNSIKKEMDIRLTNDKISVVFIFAGGDFDELINVKIEI